MRFTRRTSLRLTVFVGAVLAGVGIARVDRLASAAPPRTPFIDPEASHVFQASGESIRFSSLNAYSSKDSVFVGVFSDGCLACKGEVQAFLDAVDAFRDPGTGVLVVLATDSVGPLSQADAEAEFGRHAHSQDAEFVRADRSMARSWGLVEYPALLSVVRRPTHRQRTLGVGEGFASVLTTFKRHRDRVPLNSTSHPQGALP